MKRDIRKACSDYDSRFKDSKHGEGAFYTSDFIQIKDMVVEKVGSSRSINEWLYETIDIAIRAGFMIGFRYGMRNRRRATDEKRG